MGLESCADGPFNEFGMCQNPIGNHVLKCLPDKMLFKSLTIGYETHCPVSTLMGNCSRTLVAYGILMFF
jgi:hypothetical protein